MGGACTKPNAAQVMTPQSQLDHAINSEFTPFLRLEHPFNVNHKYQAFFIYNKNEFLGFGIKKTFSYQCKLTKEELVQKRKEFWDTRVEGNKATWQALQMAVDADENTGIAILASAGIKLVNKSIQISYDESGYKYDIPIFCINEPQSYEAVSQHQRNINLNYEKKDIKIKVRAPLQGDTELCISNSTTIQEIKKLYQEKINVKFFKIRLFVQGRELYESNSLGNYDIENEQIVQAFTFNASQ